MSAVYDKNFYGTDWGQVSGLAHLEGLTVSVIMDGAYVGDFVVSGGAIQLDEGLVATDEIVVGLDYTCELETMPLGFFNSSLGPVYGQAKRIATVGLFLYQTLGFSFRFGSQAWQEEEFRDETIDMENAPPLVTKYKSVNGESGYTQETTVGIRQTKPYPLNINLMQLTLDLGK